MIRRTATLLCLLLLTASTLYAWEIEVTGVRSASITEEEFQEAKNHSVHSVEAEFELKGETHLYRGMPLAQIVAMVDGLDSRHPYSFDRGKWEDGYEVTITASDGYAATFVTSEVPDDAILFVDEMDGSPVSPRLVGTMSRKLWVRDVAAIEVHLGEIASRPDPDFRLILEVNKRKYRFSLNDLLALPYYVEGPGSYTTSAGTTYTSDWGGVRLADFLNGYMALSKEDTITFVATDGYEMSYNARDVVDESEGTWILALMQDGEYLPLDPGYLRTIKIGPDTPNISGHSSVRMIGQIRVSGTPYKEFQLGISGRKNSTLDRQTIQSCVSCHRQTVSFERKSTKAEFTGTPLWRFLAYADDPDYVPHGQDSSIVSYRRDLALDGYAVEIEATDGFVVTLSSHELDANDDVILAMYREGEELPEGDWPLVLVWDKETEIVPDGIKPIRQISEIRVLTD